MSTLVNGLILLLATALISGLLAPWIVNRIQTRNQQRLKVYEADLTRQSKIIDEQGAMIQRLSSLLWEFQLNLIAPLYYGQAIFRKNLKPYEDAVQTYLGNSSRMLGAIRAEIGAAVRLVPPSQWATLKDLFYKELLQLDLQVTQLISEGPTDANSARWSRLQKYVLNDLALALDETIDGLSDVLRLKYWERVGSERPAPRTFHGASAPRQ